MKKSIRVKFVNYFRNPHSNRFETVGTEMIVPKDQFWLRRIKCGDCELSSDKVKPAFAALKTSKKGSKS